jgi:DNA primase catalytic core
MARIAEDLIARLKAELPLERVVAASGVELVRRGKDLVARCPFHDDAEPSLVVTPGKGLWRCFGCDKGGTVIDWRMEISGESFRAAVESLAAAYLPGAALEETEPPATPAVEPFSPEEVAQWLATSDEELLQRVAVYYRERLDVDPRGREYLERRGLLDEAAIERFGIGLADRTLGLRLPAKQVKAGEQLRSRLARLGILREESGHEHLAGSLVVPIRDLGGRVVQMYGRKVTATLRKGTPLHLYLAGSRNCVFHPEALVESDEVILCESILDALTFWTAGFRHTTCAFGVHGFTEALHEAMRAHGTRRVLFAYDRDEAGEKAAVELATKLLAEGIECFRVLFPRGMDANEYAQKVKPASKSLELVVRQASWMGTGRPPAALVLTAPATAVPELAELVEVAPAAAEEAAPSLAAAPTAERPRPPSSPVAPAPRLEVPAEVGEREVVIRLGDRRYRVRGLEKNLSADSLKVNLLASRNDGFFVDTLDLYVAKQRERFKKQAALELALDEEAIQRDLGRVLLKLEELQDQQLDKALAPKTPRITLSDAETEAALCHWRRPDLIAATREHLSLAIVGEETNKLLVYLAAVSRQLSRPLAVLVQSSSAAGKSALLDGVLSLMPEEERVAYSAMTGQSLFYMGEKDLRHKILSIAEEEGAERARYALKLLQSEGKLSIASTGKDPQTGRLLTHEYHVEGPAAILTTTTALTLDEEFENRCLVLSVDESREQTEAIHRFQRYQQTLEGLAAREERRRVVGLHRNAQRLLRPLHVVNPFAEQLRYPTTSTRTRRDQMKYLGMIEAIALLHQHQRETKALQVGERSLPYVEVTLSDIELANDLASRVLGRTLDELPPQTLRLLEAIHAMASEATRRLAIESCEVRFSRRQVREATGWSHTQLHMHLKRLEDLEYLLVHRGTRGQSYVYELLWNGEGARGEAFVMGLLDVERLGAAGYDGKYSGSAIEYSGSIRPHFGDPSGGFPEPEAARSGAINGRSLRDGNAEAATALLGEERSVSRRSQRVAAGGR